MAAIARRPHPSREVRLGLTYSVAIHGLIIAALLVGLPWYRNPEILPPPPVIDVQLAKIGEKTNVPPELRTRTPTPPPPARKTHIAKPVAPKPAPKVKTPPAPPPPKPKVEAAKPIPVPPPPKPEPKPMPEPKPQPKPEPKPKPKPKAAEAKPVPVPKRMPAPPPAAKPKPAFDASKLAQMLNLAIKHENPSPQAEKTKKPVRSYSQTPDNTSEPLSLSLVDAVRERIERNWSVPPGACGKNIDIVIDFTLNPDGSLQGPPEIQGSAADPIVRAAALSAERAIYESQPFKELPAKLYSQWQSIEMHFSPKDVCQ